MSEELKELLEKNLKVSEESLRLLKKMRRATILSAVLTTIKWVVVIVLLVVGFIQIQPYLGQFTQIYRTFLDIIKTLKDGGALLP